MSYDFLVEELNIDFDIKEALDYLNLLETKYSYLRWNATPKNLKDTNDAELQEEINGVYGWGIQSNLNNLNEPCPPYHVHKHGNEEYKDTELVFGFIEKIKKVFPNARQFSVAAHPRGTKIRRHKDNSKYCKIHVPLITNDKAWFIFDDSKLVLTPGKFYLINTDKEHSTYNEGESIRRTHLFFKIPVEDVDKVRKISVSL